MTRLPTLLISLLLLACAQAAMAQRMVSVDRPEINMRAGAGTQHEALWSLTKGYPLEVVSSKGRWLQVRDFENDTGWVYRPLVGDQAHMVVKSRVANLRSAPGTHARIVGRAEHGEVLRTMEKRPQWVKVQRADGLKAWVSRTLVWGW